jgi:RNA polymerase sigma factor (sigma-70 family)
MQTMVNAQRDINRELADLPSGPPPEGQSDRQLLERFTRLHDGAAFAALVQRHGPLVLSVCRRVLQHAHDAEDAFQATFLVLVRKAGSIAKPDSLANWLYGVAFRTARKARTSAARRRNYERQAITMGVADLLPEVTWRELRATLDEELYHLPDKYREPLVLCYLQGKTNEEAAHQLGWPIGSMSARLARGRELLRDRLASRNRAVPPVLLASLLARVPEAASVPAHLREVTVQAALSLAAGGVAGSLSPAVRALVEGTGKATGSGRSAVLVALLLALAALMLGGAVLAHAGLGKNNNQGALPQQPPSEASSGAHHCGAE